MEKLYSMLLDFGLIETSDASSDEKNEIIDVIEAALARAGYDMLDVVPSTITIRNTKEDKNFEIRIEEVFP